MVMLLRPLIFRFAAFRAAHADWSLGLGVLADTGFQPKGSLADGGFLSWC